MTKTTHLEIIEKLDRNQEKIINNLDQESIDVYLWLKNEYEKRGVTSNTVFQFVFRSYYSLDGAGLGEKLKSRYFELLAQEEKDLNVILKELSKIPTQLHPHTVQFSFATKLIHMIDNSKPIYDKWVAAIIHKTVTGKNAEEKIESAKGIFNYLEELYGNLLGDEKTKKVIEEFRKQFKVDNRKIADQKILDFLIWSLGRLGL